jgi:hypothetical protein
MKGERTMKLKAIVGVFLGVAALWLGGGNLLAQDDQGPGPGGPGGGPGGDFDPAQFRQHMMDQIRKNMSVTNDDEWSAIQPLIQKVMEARREANNGGGMGMPGPGFGPGGPGGPGGNSQGPGGPGGAGGGPGGFGGGGRFGPQASDEQKALQKALDDHAPIPQIKNALAQYRAARKEKQAKLEAAQASLKSVLTLEQEAQAVLMGLLP